MRSVERLRGEQTASPPATPSDNAQTPSKSPTRQATGLSTPSPYPARGVWTYALKYKGATGEVYFPVPATDPRLAEVERYRKAAKDKLERYVIVQIDNTSGFEDLDVVAVDIYNARGAHTYEAEGLDGWISFWEANKGGPRPPRNPRPKMSKVARRYEASYEIAPGEQRTLLYFPGAAPGPTTHRDRCHRC